MNFKFMSMAAMAACVAFTSCSNDEVSSNEGHLNALSRVNVGIQTQKSRAGITAESFSGSESIGLFLFGEGGITADGKSDYNIGTTGKLAEPVNIKYFRGEGVDKVNPDGTPNPEWFVSDNPIILSAKAGKLYSYYPWAEGNVDANKIPVTVALNQGTGITDGTADDATYQYDYMWSTPVPSVNNTTQHVNLTMNHALAMVSFKFVRNTYPGEGKITSIQLKNGSGSQYLLSGDATMNIGTGALDLSAAASDKVIYCEPNQVLVWGEGIFAGVQEGEISHQSLPRMLVYPNATNIADGDVVLSITMDGKTYELNLPAELSKGANKEYAWTAGQNYLYTLNMNGYGFGANDEDGKDDIDVTITKWNVNETVAGEMNKPIN